MAGTKKILLVEDDNNLREIYGARLQAEGYEIVSAPDGENALAIAVKEKPDLIISDIMMPKVSGFDMLDILRNAPETRDTKVIMMTALSQAEDKARADKLGADMYLVKSQVTLEDVTKAVHQILDEPTDSAQEADSAAAQEMVSGGADIQEPAEKASDQPQEQPVAVTPQEEPPKEEVPVQQSEPPKQEPSITTEPVSVTPIVPPVADDISVKPEPPTEAPVENTADNQTPTSSTVIPVSISDDNIASDSPTAVEPSLAQALEDEEKAVQGKIENFEKSEQQAADNITPPSQPAVEASPPAPADDNAPVNPLDDRPSKKVIAPINDPTKAPDINDLVAQEEAKEAAGKNETDQTANQVIKPQISDDSQGQAPQDAQSSTGAKDDFGKISL